MKNWILILILIMKCFIKIEMILKDKDKTKSGKKSELIKLLGAKTTCRKGNFEYDCRQAR